MEKTTEATSSVLWGILGGYVIAGLMTVLDGLRGRNPSDAALNIAILTYLSLCFLAGSLAGRVRGFSFALTFGAAMALTIQLLLWGFGIIGLAVSIPGFLAAVAGALAVSLRRRQIPEETGMPPEPTFQSKP